MNNLVTGATGLVGMHILLDLLSKGEKVKASFTKNSRLENVKKLFKFYFFYYHFFFFSKYFCSRKNSFC